MSQIKTFEEFVNEGVSNPKITIRFQDDEYGVTGCDMSIFDISKIPVKILKKQYVDFKSLIKSPPTFGDPLMQKSKSRRLNEGESRKTFDVYEVKKTILKNYLLDESQFFIHKESNDIEVILFVPHIEDNEEMIIEDMMSLGYYVSMRGFATIDKMEYSVIRFDPRYPKDITDKVRQMKVIKHLTPKYNLESIKEKGFIPLNKNEVFNYPPRIHFLKEEIDYQNIVAIGEQLCEYNTNKDNDGTYVLFTLDVSKIPDNVRFIGDSCYELGICTENNIPYDVVIDVREIKFNV